MLSESGAIYSGGLMLKPCEMLADVVASGARVCSLGIQRMPDGFVLLQNDDGYYTWFEEATGRESPICWNRWWVYRWAKQEAVSR